MDDESGEGMAHSICGCTSGWQVKLSDPRLTRTIPKCFRDEYHTQYKVLYEHSVYLLYFTHNTVIPLDPIEVKFVGQCCKSKFEVTRKKKFGKEKHFVTTCTVYQG